MDLLNDIKSIAQRYQTIGENIQTEEATKNALIMPFIQALGYDVFNPSEVVPEFTADVANRKGEKIDYAIFSEGKPIILVECKWCGTKLTQDNTSQLARYFMVVPARIALLTNGVDYEFYSDIDEPKILDKRPFFKFNINEVNETCIREIKKFAKENFCIDEIIPAAEELKYTNEMKKYLMTTLTDPDEDFVKLLTKKVYDGRLTAPVYERFSDITKKAITQFISERVSDRLSSALREETKSVPSEDEKHDEPHNEGTEVKPDDGIITTPEEIEAYNIVRAILCKYVKVEKVAIRDAKSYCGVLYDDNNRYPICRFYFKKTTMYITTMDENKAERRHDIKALSDIYYYADEMIETVKRYQGE